MQITEAELMACRRAVLRLHELAQVALLKAGVSETPQAKHDEWVLMQVLKRLEKIATKGDKS